jgi:hypothetical protein
MDDRRFAHHAILTRAASRFVDVAHHGRHPGESRDPSSLVIPAQAGIQPLLELQASKSRLPTEASGNSALQQRWNTIKMDSGLRRNDEQNWRGG